MPAAGPWSSRLREPPRRRSPHHAIACVSSARAHRAETDGSVKYGSGILYTAPSPTGAIDIKVTSRTGPGRPEPKHLAMRCACTGLTIVLAAAGACRATNATLGDELTPVPAVE